MRKWKKYILYLTLLLPVLTCSCSSSLPNNDLPDIGVPQEQINQDFELSSPRNQNSFKIGNEVILEIKVISRNEVWFPPDCGARIFVYEKDHWVDFKRCRLPILIPRRISIYPI